MKSPDQSAFLQMPTEAIVALTREHGRPRVGIFVPDGNRRLVLSTTQLEEGSDEFLAQVAVSQTTLGLDTLKVFFGHGLSTLFTPLFSRSVLARGTSYRNLVVLKTLEIMFTGDAWLKFFKTWDVRLRVYGDLSALRQLGCEQAHLWIEQVQRYTQTHTTHALFVGLGGEPLVGHDSALAASRFYRKYEREANTDELVEFLYGRPVPQADFVVFTSYLSGLGALPALVCGKDTQMYSLAAPGVMALTPKTYRMILYDLLFMRDDIAGQCCYGLDQGERARLRLWYANHVETVIGVGRRIGTVWIPEGLDGSRTS
jgi:hypothetical protein